MSVDSRKQIQKTAKQRTYLNRDFDEFKSTLLSYARTHFPDNIKDFSESSLGGLFLDFAAYVGDVDAFYLDHQFHELNPEYATESGNIQNLLKNAGVSIVGSSPAVVTQTFYVEVPATTSVPPIPSVAALPIIQAGSIVAGDNGIQFELVDDINFNDLDDSGDLVATVVVSKTDANNNPTAFILSRKGTCISGFRNTETFSMGAFQPYKTYTLSQENVTEIISVTDDQGNTYYEVEYLTQDTVFEAVLNKNEDNQVVQDTLIVTPAPFRFTKNVSLDTRLTTLTFGGGTAQALDDDVIPDPSEYALPLYGKKNFSRFTLNPSNLLQTTTLGIVAPNSSVTVIYRYGGGLSHNLSARSIRGVKTLSMTFPNNPTASVAQFVRSSIDSVNEESASGGEDAPTPDELKLRIPAIRASQSRIVTKEDLIARVYTMPSNFGRVFRASCLPDPNNPLASRLYIVSRDSNNRLTISPDSLKENLSTYLNQYRLTNDSIDILDAQIINLIIDFSIVIDPVQNKNIVKQNVIKKLKDYFNIKNFEIGQPIFINDIENIIYNNPGIFTITGLNLTNIFGTISSGTTSSEDRIYSDVRFDVASRTDKKIIFPPNGGIFEIRYKDYDIRCQVVS